MFSKQLAYLKREPVRVNLYTVVGLVLGLLVAKGILPESELPYVLGIAAAILGVESLRSKVTPNVNVPPTALDVEPLKEPGE